jgi:hypothetical protein
LFEHLLLSDPEAGLVGLTVTSSGRALLTRLKSGTLKANPLHGDAND